MTKIGRLLTAMVTPFDAAGAVDFAQARKLASALMDSGSEGLIVVGTTGESPTLTLDEELRLFKETKEEIGDRGAIVAGTGSNSTAEAIEATMEAEKLGVDAALLVVPYYNKPTQEGLYQHFKAIASKTSLPCILYNVPSRTITGLSPETIARLSKIDNIIGLKDAGGNFKETAAVLDSTPDDFIVWSGNDTDTFHLLTLGGYGVISVASHLVGNQIAEMIKKFLDGDIAGSAKIHRDLLPLVNALFVVSNPIPVKYAVNQVGFNVGGCRLPLVGPDEKTAAAIMDVVKKYRIDLPVK